MKKNRILIILTILLILILSLFVIYSIKNNKKETVKQDNVTEIKGILNKDDFELINIDKNNYKFSYNNEEFNAIYSKDNWKIINSYKITNSEDIYIICTKLIEINPIHASDMINYRTAEDMRYEWLQHNMAYMILPDENPWKINAKDVDLDPFDQGKSIFEIYENRTGEKLINSLR